jgi:hypothetical protein
MNEPDFERSLGEWMRTGRSGASSWVLESVVEHAHQKPNRSWWARLQGAWSGDADTSPAWRRHIVGLTAVAATATAVLVAVPLVMTVPSQHPDEAPAFAPASPDTAATSPAPVSQVGFPDGASTGAVWLEQAEGEVDHYITLHPDGTLVERINDLGSPVGIGLWRPDGQGRISSVVVYSDADPERHQARGLSTYRADWTLDETAESGLLAWSAQLQPIDGTSLPNASGHSRLTRLHRLGLPPEAMYDPPSEPAWVPTLGPVAQGNGSGSVAVLSPTVDDCESHDLPGLMVVHGDGTAFFTSPKGSGAGLWIPSGPDTRALTGWSPLPDMPPIEGWVGQLKHRALVVGTTETFDGLLPSAPRRLVGLDGTFPPPADAGLWPDKGTVWLESTESGTAITAYLTDGTVVARHPRLGVGAGYWQPLDGDTITTWVSFRSAPGWDMQMRSQATMASDGESMSMTAIFKDTNTGAEDERIATATRLHLEP